MEYINDCYIDLNIVKKISKEIAFKIKILPLYIKNDKVYIAACDKLKTKAIDYLKFIYQKDIEIIHLRQDLLMLYIKKYFNKEDFNEAIQKLNYKSDIDKIKIGLNQNELVKNVIKEAPTVKITDHVLKSAIDRNASDIHFEPFAEYTNVRFRIDGILYFFTKIPNQIYNFVVTRIKIMANMDISQSFVPCDGKIQYNYDNYNYDFRVSSIPTINGEKIVIRILYKNFSNILLKQIGFSNVNYNLIKSCLKCANGMILVTGPTGSGKSTTLYSLINELNNDNINITTIEDPVEYSMSGVNQINVNDKAGLNFALGLRSILRQDPDVIMIGEIRDYETAEISTRAAITGHLVLSSLHTKDSASAVLRLIDIGIQPYIMADTLIAVVAQRLLRKICPYCKKEYVCSEEEMKIMKISKKISLYKGVGCSKCNNTGYKGRIIVSEVMIIDKKSREIIKNCKNIDMLRQYNLKNGMVTLKDNAVNLIIKGVTTCDELIKNIL